MDSTQIASQTVFASRLQLLVEAVQRVERIMCEADRVWLATTLASYMQASNSQFEALSRLFWEKTWKPGPVLRSKSHGKRLFQAKVEDHSRRKGYIENCCFCGRLTNV